jgi:hypothetical protein
MGDARRLLLRIAHQQDDAPKHAIIKFPLSTAERRIKGRWAGANPHSRPTFHFYSNRKLQV